MENSINIIGTMLNTVQGTILLFSIFIALVALVIFIIVKILPRTSAIGPWKFLTKYKIAPGGKSNLSPDIILSLVGSEYDKFILSKEELNSRINEEIKKVQQQALTRSIEHLCLEFSKIYEETPENSIQKMGKILELYLHKDFSGIVLEKLNYLYNSSILFLNKTDGEISQETAVLVEDCVRTMKININNYILISDVKILHKLFDTANDKIKSSIEEAIKNFIRLTKEQQHRILEITKIRTEAIEKRINELTRKDTEE